MSARIRLKAFSVLTLAAAFTFAAHAQIISTTAGNPVISGRTATAISIYEPTSVATDPSGNVYFATGNFTSQVYRINPGGIVSLVAGNGNYGNSGDGTPATSAELSNPTGIAIDNSGNIYIADADASVVRKVTASTGLISTVAGNGTAGYSGNGAAATAAMLHFPLAVALDASGNLYIADTDNNAVRKVDASTLNISTIAGNVTAGYTGNGGLATNALLNYPSGLAVDGSGNIFIVDSNNSAIRKISASTNFITTVAGNGTAGYSGNGGAATSAQLNYPAAVAVDASGNIFIADSFNSVIREVSASTSDIATVAGNGTYGSFGNGVLATSAELSYPQGVAVDGSGNLFIADEANYLIREVSASNDISTYAGNGYYSYSGDGGPATSAQIESAYAMKADVSGNIYLADTYNSVVRKIDGTTGNISTVAGNGIWGYSGDGGAATSASISYPYGVSLDNSSNLYIADSDNAVIRKVDAATGTISTVAGNGISGYSGDNGLAINAQFDKPSALATDFSGNLYIADRGNLAVRMVNSSGGISTVAGNGTGGYSGDNGAATNAQLSDAAGIGLDKSGNLFIADAKNGVIREVILNPADVANFGIIKTVAGGGASANPTDALANAFTSPTGVFVDNAGTIFISDSVLSRAFKITGSTFASPSSGALADLAGNGIAGFSGDGGPAISAELFNPFSLAGNNLGNLLIADVNNYRIRSVAGVVATAPISVVAPSSLAFDPQVLNQGIKQTKSVTISNPGVSPLTVSTIIVSGTNAADFTEGDNCTTAPVAAGSSCTINVTFAAKVAGSESATLTITSTALASPQTVALSGTGVFQQAVVSPASLTFDPQVLNQGIKQTKSVTVSNPGASPFTVSSAIISGANAVDFTEADNCTSAPVAAGSSCTINVTFAANVNGSEAATLTITSSASTSPQTVALSGTGVFQQAVVSPASLTFDPQVLNQGIKQTKSVTVSNPGASPFTVSSAIISGANAVDFTEADNCSAAPVAAGSSCTINVTFAAKVNGSEAATLTITSTASTSPQTVPLSGTGIFQQAVVSPASLTFDPQVIGQGNKQTKSITVSNPGTSPFTVSSATISGANAADFTEADNCTVAPVAAGSSCTINVTFAARIAGSEAAVLTVSSSASTSPQTVALSGTGIAQPQSTLSSNLLIYTTQLLNTSATSSKVITVTNTGTASMTIASIVVSGTNAADFVPSGTCFGATITAGSTCTVNIAFAATVAGNEAATLTITSNAPSSPQTVALTGAGITFAAPSAATGGSTSATVTNGSSATYSLQVSASGGATLTDPLTINLSCSGAPTGATCSAPASIIATPGTPGAFTLTVTTTKSGELKVSPLASAGGSSLPRGMGLALIPFGAILLGISRKRRKLSGLFLLALLAATISSIGCVAPVSLATNATTGTAAGTYTLTVTATSGVITKSTPLTLIVK